MIDTLLNEVYDGLHQGHVGPALTYLYAGLHEARVGLSPAAWRAQVDTVCLPHRLTELIHQDPLIGGSFRAARRHRPDYRFLDSIYYGVPVTVDEITPLGKTIFAYTVNSAMSQAVRQQRRRIARLVDATAADVAFPRVLALEPGYMRAAELSFSLASGDVAHYTALSDSKALLARVARMYGRAGVKTVHGSLSAIAQGRQALTRLGRGELDLIYAPLLFSQLSERPATMLAARMWEALRPGGRLLIANFLTDCLDAAFLDCYGGWRFHYRSLGEIAGLIREIPGHEVDALDLTSDCLRTIGTLILRKQ